jgi:hypothetical protein
MTRQFIETRAARRKLGLLNDHHWKAVTDVKAQPAALADELVFDLFQPCGPLRIPRTAQHLE